MNYRIISNGTDYVAQKRIGLSLPLLGWWEDITRCNHLSEARYSVSRAIANEPRWKVIERHSSAAATDTEERP